jgi:hypothetical protein
VQDERGIEKFIGRIGGIAKIYLQVVSLSVLLMTWAQNKLSQLCDFFTGVSSSTSNDTPA